MSPISSFVQPSSLQNKTLCNKTIRSSRLVCLMFFLGPSHWEDGSHPPFARPGPPRNHNTPRRARRDFKKDEVRLRRTKNRNCNAKAAFNTFSSSCAVVSLGFQRVWAWPWVKHIPCSILWKFHSARRTLSATKSTNQHGARHAAPCLHPV